MAGTVLGNRDQRVRLGDYVVAGFERPANAACQTIEVGYGWRGGVGLERGGQKACKGWLGLLGP
jgi:hypothetical protein